jgi:hypothetical protein
MSARQFVPSLLIPLAVLLTACGGSADTGDSRSSSTATSSTPALATPSQATPLTGVNGAVIDAARATLALQDLGSAASLADAVTKTDATRSAFETVTVTTANPLEGVPAEVSLAVSSASGQMAADLSMFGGCISTLAAGDDGSKCDTYLTAVQTDGVAFSDAMKTLRPYSTVTKDQAEAALGRSFG